MVLAGAVRLPPERLADAGVLAAHALTEVEPDVSRCRADPGPVLTELAARVLAQEPESSPRT